MNKNTISIRNDMGMVKTKEEKPSWFNQNIEIDEASDEDIKALEARLGR